MNALKKHWPILAAVGVAVVGIVVYEKHAKASTPSLPSSTQVALQPGATAVAIAKNGSILLTLPTGATWTSLQPLQASATPPSGSAAFNVTFGTQTGTFPLVATWVDSTGKTQTTTVNVSVA